MQNSVFRMCSRVLESDIETAVCKRLFAAGVKNRKGKTPTSRGYPDRLFFMPNAVVVFVEFKRPGGVLSALQEIEIEDLRALGHVVLVVDEVEDAVTRLLAIKTACENGEWQMVRQPPADKESVLWVFSVSVLSEGLSFALYDYRSRKLLKNSAGDTEHFKTEAAAVERAERLCAKLKYKELVKELGAPW